MTKKQLFYHITRYGILACAIMLTLVLCIESLLPGNVSSQHSSNFGDLIDVPVNKVVEPTDLSLSAAHGELSEVVSVGQSITLMAVFTPQNATYKQIQWSVSDDNIAHFQGDTVTFLAAGNVTVTVMSKYNPELHDSFDFIVNEVAVTGIIINNAITELAVGNSITLSATVSPQNATNKGYVFSSNSANVKIEGNKLTALSQGVATITVTSAFDSSITDSITINIITVSAQSIGFYQGNTQINEITVDIHGSQDVSIKILPSNATNKDITWETSGGIELYFYSLTSFKVIGDELGQGTITARLTDGPTATLNVTVKEGEAPPPADVIVGISASNLTVSLTQSAPIKYSPITQNGGAAPTAEYLFEVTEGQDVISVNTLGIVTALKKGTAKVKISIENSDIYKEISVAVTDLFISSLTIVSLDLPDAPLIVKEQYHLGYEFAPQGATATKVTWSCDNEQIATVSDNGYVKFHTFGTVTVTLTAEGGATTSITLTAKNVLKIKTVKDSGFDSISKFEDHKATASLKINHSGSFSIVYDDSATYKGVVIESSNPDVVNVHDNTVTALKKGTATLTLTYWDGNPDFSPIVLTVEVTVTSQRLSDFFANWSHTIRKSFGHFAAFLVLGVFVALSFSLFMKNKFFAAPLAVASGFFVAGLTEFFQMLTPNRGPSFSDVMLDFQGYCWAAIPISIVFIILYAIKLIKAKKDKTTNNNEEIISE